MDSNLQSVFDIKGQASEYHVNNTLHRVLNAVRFSENSSQGDAFLFDGILLPTPSKTRSQPFTEVDHLLIATQGLFAIETKSISGKVFGEKNSKKWHSAQAVSFKKDGLHDRGFTNPFKQNSFHVAGISNVLKENDLKAWVNNFVVVVDADEYGWEKGHWGSEQIDGLFLSAIELAEQIQAMPVIFSYSEIRKIARAFQPHYAATEANMTAFKSHH